MEPVQKPDNPENPSGGKPNVGWVFLIFFGMLIWLWFFNSQGTLSEISWNEFETELLIPGKVAKLDVVNNERVEVYLKTDSLPDENTQQLFERSQGPQFYFNIGSVEVFHEQLKRVQENNPIQPVSVTYSKRENWGWQILSWIIPFALIIFFWLFLIRRMSTRMTGSSMTNFGQTKARVMETGQESMVTFKDVAGLEEAKEEIYELVNFLKAPEKYRQLGAKIPKGILLLGPPGTGKTLLAKAVAGEAGVPFFSLSGSEFIEMFVGVGAARVRDLFRKAKAKTPSIIFIDEIDTIGRARSGGSVFHESDERDSTLNQLLAELDGFGTNTGVIVLAATNRGELLDPALLRPGRFDRHIQLELPNQEERKQIFLVHMRPLVLSDDVDVEMLAAQTPGFSGADIANICNEAALFAAHREKQKIERQDFLDAIDRVVGGMEKRSKIISAEEKRRVAFHEAGHVATSWYLKFSQPVQKVSIIPRGRSLGAAWYLPEEHQIITKSEFLDAICTALGGRVAEELFFEEASSNAIDDLEKATKQAYSMVLHFGFSQEIRNISYYDSTGKLQQSLHKPYSERTAEKIDREVQAIIDQAFERSKEILSSHREQVETLASELIRRETLQKDDIQKILGERISA